MDVFTKHQVAIAKRTLRLSDMGAAVMGGMTKEQARRVLLDKAEWSQGRIDREESR